MNLKIKDECGRSFANLKIKDERVRPVDTMIEIFVKIKSEFLQLTNLPIPSFFLPISHIDKSEHKVFKHKPVLILITHSICSLTISISLIQMMLLTCQILIFLYIIKCSRYMIVFHKFLYFRDFQNPFGIFHTLTVSINHVHFHYEEFWMCYFYSVSLC